MTRYLLLFFCLFFSVFSLSQTAPIPDTNFEQFLIDQGIDTNGSNGNILNTDAQAVTNLNITRNDIVDFTGLEAFVNLITLNAGQNQVPTIPLTTLTLLEELRFARNTALATLDLTQNIALRVLAFNNDAAPPLLTTLDLSQNINLEDLNIRTVRSITSLTLPATPTLVNIYVANLSVPTIDLSQLTGDLRFRIVGSSVFVTIIYPNKRDALKNLTLSSINFPSVDVTEMIGLERLSLSSTNVETLLLPSTNTLTNINILHHNLGSSLDLSPVPALTNLDIRFAKTLPLEIDLTNNPVLQDVWLTHNLMNVVDVTQNPELSNLRIYNNNLTSLDVTQNLKLNRLEAYQNQLPSIDLSQNLNLQYLNLRNNQLPTLDVTQNTKIRSINIGDNLFTGTGLDVTQNPELTSLTVDNNQIESLDITQNTNLSYFDISFNIFPGNNILNQFSNIIAAQGRLRGSLIANNNLLSGPIPDFYGLYDPMVQTRRFRLYINENNFHFGDFESQHLDLVDLTTTMSIGPAPDFVIDKYYYAPQTKVNAIENPTRNAGESITLLTEVRGTQNHYKWFKDGVEIPDAADSPELILTDLNTCDAGVYHAEITSDLVPFENTNPPGTDGKNLLLIRNDITLTVNATKACVSLNMIPLDNVPINSGLRWHSAPGACGYKISMGVDPGGTDILDNEDVGDVNVYNFASDLIHNKEYYVTITPYYADGDFTGCAEEFFITNTSFVGADCTTLSSPLDGSINIATDLSRIEWNPANAAEEYDITISSPSGSNDIVTTTTETFISLTNDFNPGEVVNVSILPKNSHGFTVGCTPESFTIVSTISTTPPNCTTLVAPANGDTDIAIDLNQISWNPVADADSYRITIDGSTSNVNDVTDLILANTTHTFTNNFDYGETVTVTIVPLNGSIEPSTACSPETFTIVANTPTGNPFVSTWETTANNETITIPTIGTGYNYTVDWGDTTTTTGETGDATHTYITPGIHTISITGDFPRIYFNNSGDKEKIRTIEQWGDIEWSSMEDAFYGCTNMQGNFTDSPNLSNVTSMRQMFRNCSQYNIAMNNWDISTITDMGLAFRGATSFNGLITNWDTSNVTSMSQMFSGATVFNQNIGNWNTSNVIAFSSMFFRAREFNQDISTKLGQGVPTGDAWNVSRASDMQGMFDGATVFNQDIGNWNTGNVTTMSSMFRSASTFNQDISGWILTNVENMGELFRGASAFNQDISNWDVSNTRFFHTMFDQAISFNQDISGWVTSSAILMRGMFKDAVNFDQNISSWNVELVTNMEDMFDGVTLSTVNYEALLIGWNAQNLQPNVSFSGGNSQYCSKTAEDARANMIASDSWIISDGGLSGPTISDLADQTHVDSYTLPTIIGTKLTGAEAYYTETNGGGTSYNAGDVISFGDFLSYPITLYIYDGSSTCNSEESFELILTETVATIPNCTTLSAPMNGDTDVATTLNQITWDVVAEATSYKVTITGTTNNNRPEFETTDTHVDFTMPFLNDEIVSVSIIPVNGTVEATGCTIQSFTIESANTTPTIPDCTTLLTPMNADTDVATTLNQITWDVVAEATSYKVTITGTTNNNRPEFETTDTHVDFTMPFLNDEIVSVSIIPVNGTVEATGCTIQSFTIESANTTPTIPDCTTLSAPANGDIGVSVNRASVSWDPVANADGYRITVSGTADNNVSNFDVITGTSYNFSNDFTHEEIVNIKIEPYNSAGTNTTCITQSFTIIEFPTTTPSCTSANSPANGATNIPIDIASVSWPPVTNASGYRITVTGTANNNVSDVDVPRGTTYTFQNDFSYGEIVDISIIPYNAFGSPLFNCPSTNFTIINDPNSSTSIPNCTSLISPMNGAINISTKIASVSWDSVTDADGYRITLGTTPNGNDILDNFDAGNTTTYNLLADLPEQTQIFVTITPYNAFGNAMGCTEESFTTETIPVVPNCSNLISPSNTATNVSISTDLNWAAISNVDGYRITVGTTSNGNDVLDNFDAGNDTSYNLSTDLPENTQIFVTITPYNAVGNAIGCTEESFTTERSISFPEEDTTKYGFSPDGNGINDYWVIDGIQNYPDNEVIIYNRWGDKVFRIVGYDNLSRVFSGEANQKTTMGAGKLPSGTYFFEIKINGNHNLKKTKGFVVIKR